MKFAHMADIHLGATSEPRLRELEMETFRKAFEECLEEDVDFVVIAGDLFHVNIPDLSVVKEATKVMMRFVETGRRIYVVYGSHDFSPNATSMVDILEEAGVIVRVGKPSTVNGMLRPEVVVDRRSGAILTGISGRKLSLEKESFKHLDREYLASFKGFKIFLFHSALDDVRKSGERFEGIASTDLPEGFDYYAGGHLHRRIEYLREKKIVYPGPLFTGWGIDLENTVKGERRGFYIVEDGAPRFLDMTAFEGVYEEVDATGLSAFTLNERLRALASRMDVRGKVVVMRVFGELSSGKTSEVEFASLREEIMKRGAIYLHLNRSQLRSREFEGQAVVSDDVQKIEEETFREFSKSRKFEEGRLNTEAVALSKSLLQQLKVPKMDGETEGDYEARVRDAAIDVLGIKDLLRG
ncbi:MAG: DNA repair exonuclease [Candidatus Methanomethylicia archaeon]|jgi:DNA repair exonuclease SbcCD nuclease subunit|uniref:Exonuclease SbcCD subunit D n=1 Tax=Thermoproteota archaeon TaxID=2056631 RepID=A0A523BFF9_9CREN|nr:DNA repair exonuclease [Candidatus Methanomethylicia archaeon]TDA39562.1 MAG: exonuclease SbcCD subunit D [Candidatus Verstraetearchaeota archaeon]